MLSSPSRLDENSSSGGGGDDKMKISVRTGKRLEKISKEALAEPDKFWADQARNLIWFKEWNHILEWNPPFARWFVGGTLNASVNCLDRHINTDTKNKAAIIWESESGETRTLSYFQLYRQVNKFANVLKSLGVSKGDRVTIYMPMVPEMPIAMLACARIGAVHSVVFSGFSAQALVDRINDADARVVITADGAYRKGQTIALKQSADKAMGDTDRIGHCIVVRRTGADVEMTDGRDHWYHDLVEGQSTECAPEA